MKRKALEMYYAEYHHYGIDTISNDDALAQFSTKEARDEWCERINSRDPYMDIWEPVTTREVRHRYNFNDFNNGDRCEEIPGARNMYGSCVFCIGHKQSYEL